jgi:hypothetical protein
MRTRIFLAWLGTTAALAQPITVSSLGELESAARGDGQEIVMRPGRYRLADWLTPERCRDKRRRGDFPLLVLRGSGNRIGLEGVEWEFDAALLRELRPPVHARHLVLAGHSNLVHGLTVRGVGEDSAPSAALLLISGRGNTVSNLTLHVRGSFPYGYGDLFGKGGDAVIAHRKQSGLLVTGHGTRMLGCVIHQRAFGHAFFVQEDAADVLFMDCRAEGETRLTEEMLQETEGPAFAAGFRTQVTMRGGEARVLPGYRKSLAEDGFRTYGRHPGLTFIRCEARHMRGGFELRSPTAARLEDCRAFGNERGFWLGSDAVATGCVGDAEAGPVLIAEGSRIRAEIEVRPTPPAGQVHALALVQGADNRVVLRGGSGRNGPPVLIGYGPPAMGEGMAPIPEADARRADVRNLTLHPVRVGTRAHFTHLLTLGRPEEILGRETRVASP